MGYYNSFVLRVWSDGRGALRGRIEHVGSRDSLVFADLGRIVGFLRAHLGAPREDLFEPGPAEQIDDPFGLGEDGPDR